MTHSFAERFFNLDLWLAGAGHFVILIASFQVPSRLGWKQDLARLMPFHRKLLWVQGGFTVLTIIAFGTLTLVLHAELLRGDRAALALAAFIGIFWTARIGIRLLLFKRGLAPGKAFRHRPFPADLTLCCARSQLPGLVHLASCFRVRQQLYLRFDFANFVGRGPRRRGTE